MHPERSREADDLTVWAGGAAGSLVEFQGCKPRTFSQLAQPAAMTGSQPSDMVVPLLQKTCTPTSTSSSLTRSHSLFTPAKNIQRWHLWFTLHHWAHHRRSGSQHFASEWHLCQGTELGSALSGRDECSSSLHLHEGNCEQMSVRAEIYNTIVLQVQGFINFSHRTSSSLRAAVFRKSLPPKMFIKNCLGLYFSLWLSQFHFSTVVSVHQFVFMHSFTVYAC